MSYTVRHELAEWVRTLTATLITALVSTWAVMTSSWVVVFVGTALIASLFYLAYRIDRQRSTPADS